MGRHFERGTVLYNLRRFKDAADAFAQELADDPNSPHSHAMRAAALGAFGQFADASQSARRAIELAPQWQYGYYILGVTESLQGKIRKAEATFLQALRLEPTTDVHFRLAKIYSFTNRIHECLEATAKALELEPLHVDSLLLRGETLLALGRLDDAQQLFQTALSDSPDNPEAHHALGKLTLKHGDNAEALGLLREARRLDPLSKNDAGAIALAYGRTLKPFCWMTRFLPRWYLWSHKKRWALFFAISVFLTIGSMPLKPTIPRDQSLPWVLLWIAITNFLIAPYTFDRLATTVAQLTAQKEFGIRWYHFFVHPILIGWLLWVHLLAVSCGFVVTATPELGVMALQFGAAFPFMEGVVRSPQRRELSRAACLFLLVTSMIMGTLGTCIMFYESPLVGVMFLTPFLILTFFADDICNWLKSPRWRLKRFTRNP